MSTRNDVLVVGGIELGAGERFDEVLSRWIDQLSSTIGSVLITSLTVEGVEVDVPVILATLRSSARDLKIGVAHRLGSGRSASVLAREATTLDHLLEGRTAIGVLGGTPEHRAEAEAVVVGLLGGEGEVSAGGAFEHVVRAPNRPGPRTPGGPTLYVIDQEAQSCRRHQPGSSPSADLLEVLDIPSDQIVEAGHHPSDADRVLLVTEPLGPIS